MAIDFTFPPEIEELRTKVRRFIADEVHQWRSAKRTIDAYQRDGNVRAATGNLPL